jgi:hypothetical protein
MRTKTKWDKACKALVNENGRAQGHQREQNRSRCAHCAIRKWAEAKPDSLLGRLWYWHTNWCPGWKSYHEHLEHHKA